LTRFSDDAFRRILRERLPEQHLDIGLVAQTFSGRQSARRFEILRRDTQCNGLGGFLSLEESVQCQRPLLLYPLPDFQLDFGAMSVPPRRFFGLAGKISE
jgi:hypothetical protein